MRRHAGVLVLGAVWVLWTQVVIEYCREGVCHATPVEWEQVREYPDLAPCEHHVALVAAEFGVAKRVAVPIGTTKDTVRTFVQAARCLPAGETPGDKGQETQQ